MLDQAVRLTDATADRFWDKSNGGYFDTLPAQDDLFAMRGLELGHKDVIAGTGE